MPSPFPLIYVPGLVQPVVAPLDDGLNLVSTVVVSQWEVDSRTSASFAMSWNIKQEGVTTTGAIAWNTEARIFATQPFTVLGITTPVVRPIDQMYLVPGTAWNVDNRIVSTLKSSSWRVIDRISVITKSITWNVLNREVAQRASSFNTLFRIYKPGVVLEEFPVAILQPIVHAIDYNQFLPSPFSTWNVLNRTPKQVPAKWNTLFTIRVQQPVAFNDNGILVVVQGASSWFLKAPVVKQQAANWNLVDRRPALGRATWQLLTTIPAQRATSWRVFNKVNPSVAVAWAMQLRTPVTKKSTWQYLETSRTSSAISFNVLHYVVDRDWQLLSNSPGGIVSSVVHPIDIGTPALQRTPNYGLCQPVVYPIDYGSTVYPGYGYSPAPGIAWRLGINPAGRVVVQVASKWNLFIIVKPTGQIAWNLQSRTSPVQNIVAYNVLGFRSDQAIIEWNIGKTAQGELRQTAIDRTDWAM